MYIAGDLIRGHTETIILARLMQRDSYGYEINKVISTLSNNRFELKEATLYTAFKRLEELGYITKSGRKGRALTLTERESPAAIAAASREPEAPAGRVPVLGDVAAGTPILAQEHIDDYIPFDTQGRDGEYFALRVRGESMLNAGILPGDLVVVHQQPTAHNGEIVVALLEDEATVKRLSRRNGEVWLLPENEAYSPIDGRHASILGKVAAVVRTYS